MAIEPAVGLHVTFLPSCWCDGDDSPSSTHHSSVPSPWIVGSANGDDQAPTAFGSVLAGGASSARAMPATPVLIAAATATATTLPRSPTASRFDAEPPDPYRQVTKGSAEGQLGQTTD
jgi:hypothetical protein